MLVEGCKMYQVIRKLKAVKLKLRTLHEGNFSNIINEANIDMVEMQILQTMLQQAPLDQSLHKQEKATRDRFRKTSLMAETFLMKRSKATWIRLGMTIPSTSYP